MIHGDLLGERARITPDSTALVLVDTGERLTYSELDERAIRCARLWRDTLGLAKGDRVGILAHNRVEYLDAFFAAGKTGIVLVTLGTRLTALELEHIVTDSGLSALLYDGAFADTVAALREMVDLEHWIALDEPTDAATGDRNYVELTAAHDTAGFEPERCAPEDTYCLLYTSGTTGRPKGVVIPHRQVLWNGYNTVCSWQLRDNDVSPHLHAALPRRRADGLPDADLHGRRHDRAASRVRRLRDLADDRVRGLHRRARGADHLEDAHGRSRVRDR